jgi:hypothetical protein
MIHFAADIIRRLTASLGYAPDPYLWPFGNGRDGDLTVTNGQTVVLTTNLKYRNVTVDVGGVLQCGNDGLQQWPTVCVSGTLTVNGTVGAGYAATPNSAFLPNGGARKSTAGAGNSADTNATPFWFESGAGGGGAAGGGDGTNNGGNGRFDYASAQGRLRVATVTNTSGTAGAGAVGIAKSAYASLAFSYWTCGRGGGQYGCGGGAGALKVAGGTNYGGKGGNGGRGGGVLDIRARSIVIGAAGVIHADGEIGTAGEDGNASNALGDIAGAGGGGGGGGGGTLCILYLALTNNGAIRAAGGTGGAKGLGKEYTAGGANQARATSDGGIGGEGSAGIVVLEEI